MLMPWFVFGKGKLSVW